MGELLEMPRQAKAPRLGVWSRTPRLPQVRRHGATSSIWPQVVPHGTGQAVSISGMFERRLEADQVSSLMIAFTDGRPPVEVLRVPDMVVEAPNWTSDGRWLIVNADGRLWRVAAAGDGELEPIDVQGIPDLNNDHVLAPDGEFIYLSANDGHIYQAPLDGGRARRITNMDRPERMHFLPGVSLDGRWLSYIGLQPSNRDWSANVFVIPTVGGADRQLTDSNKPSDGCEFTPDGVWIFFNTEMFSRTPGHAQIARVRTNGSDLQQLTFDERVNWFPHVSPDGSMIIYLSYPPGTKGHPPNLQVQLRLVRDEDWANPEVMISTFGGQGTINVNSWAPDSQRFAYVAYPVGER
jgi:TolB protein